MTGPAADLADGASVATGPRGTRPRSETPDARAVIVLDRPLDLVLTVAPLRHGPRDPTIRFAPRTVALAFRTAAGPATLSLRHRGAELHAEAWGAGAAAALRHARRLAGLDDAPDALIPRHRIVAELAHRFAGVRLPWTGRPFAAVVPAILEQKVTGTEAFRAWRRLVLRHGDPAPGPAGLMLPPEPATLAGLPYHAFHPLGVERRRAEVIRAAAALAGRLPRIDDGGAVSGAERSAQAELAARMLGAIAGIGPWTLAEVRRVAYGDPDAVSVGDYHIPHLVAWLLAGEPRGSDARMLELLAPYRGQRGRVQRLFELSGRFPPRRAPRMAPRDIARI